MGLYTFSTDAELFPNLNPADPSWFSWNTLMKYYDGSKLSKAEEKFFFRVTGGLSPRRREDIPRKWCIIVGRRGGKSRFVSRVIPYRSIVEFNKPLHPGQEAENILIAPNMTAGMIDIEYIERMLEDNEALYNELVPEHEGQKPIIKNSQMARMHFRNGTGIRLSSVSRTAGRGRSIWTLVMDEAAHFKTEGRFSDEEIYKSARPGMSSFGMDAMCFVITTPWTKEGLVWKVWNKYFGVKNDSWLVIQGSTKDFNPTVTDKFLATEKEADPETFKREYMAQFLDSVYGAFSAEAIEYAKIQGRHELPYNPAFRYFAFIDAAGLSMSESAKFNDEFCTGVAHVAGKMIVIDVIRAWKAETNGKRVTPDEAVSASIELLQRYKVKDVLADRVASGFIEYKFQAKGFKYGVCPLIKSDLYLYAIPIVNDSGVELLDNETCTRQLKGLQRKRGRTRDHIDHPSDGHDDRANVVAGLIYMGRERMGLRSHSASDIRAGKPTLAEMSQTADELAGMM